MRLPAQLPHQRLDRQRELALRAKLGTLLFRLIGFIQIHSAIGTFHQIVINVRAAIAAFDFIIFGWGSEAGGHEEISSSI